MQAPFDSAGSPRRLDHLRLVLRNFRRMLPMLWQVNPWMLLLQLLLTGLLAFLPAANLLLTKRLIDVLTGVLQGEQFIWAPLLTLVVLQALAELLSSGTTQLQSLVTAHYNQQVEHHLQVRLIDKTTSVHLSEFDAPAFYDKLQQARTGLSLRGVRWLEQATTLIREVAALVTVLLIVGRVHPGLVLATAATLVPVLIVQLRFGSLRFFLMQFQTPNARRLHYFAELLTTRPAAAELRVFGLARYFRERWQQLFWQTTGESLALRRKGAGVSFVSDIAALAAGSAAILFLIWRMGADRLSVGDYVLVIQALQTARNRGMMAAFSLAQLFEDALFVTGLFDFLALPDRLAGHPSGTRPFPTPLVQGIEVAGLTYRYPSAQTSALRDVSFQIRAGERVAIVGENGSGKSTLVKCLLGLYQPDCGAVRYDGVDLCEIAPDALHTGVTAIFQDFMSYQMSVRENVTLGDLRFQADESRLLEAFERSGAAEFVSRLPQGADTELGNQFAGVDLSKGQWQKLAMARAFFRDTPVVAMDEPTASLDPQTEALVFEQFADLARGKTALLVSHRLGMCHSADRILVMKQGELVETGTHRELMALDGEYARMYRLQADWYDRTETTPITHREDREHVGV